MGIIVCPTFEKFWEEKREGKKTPLVPTYPAHKHFFLVAFLIYRLPIHQRRKGQGFGEPSIKHIQLLKRPFFGRVRLEARWEKQPTMGSTRTSRGGNLRQNKAWLFTSQQVLNCLPRCIFFFLNVCAGKCLFERFLFISLNFGATDGFCLLSRVQNLSTRKKNMNEKHFVGDLHSADLQQVQ